MAVQNPFFGKREPEPFQPRQPAAAPLGSAALNPGGAQAVQAAQAAASAKAATESVGSKLTVGPNIKLKGVEITDCDTLVVEGTVEATMDSRVIQIAEQGAFRGSAEIDIAEIRGEFNGTLTVRSRADASDVWTTTWTTLDRPAVTTLQSSPSLASADGQLFVGVIGADGAAYLRARTDNDNAWAGTWITIGTPGSARAFEPVATMICLPTRDSSSALPATLIS